jgi:hypothetical protein
VGGLAVASVIGYLRSGHVMLFDPRQAFETKILLGDPYQILMEMIRHFAFRSAVLRLSLRPWNRSGGPENERWCVGCWAMTAGENGKEGS